MQWSSKILRIKSSSAAVRVIIEGLSAACKDTPTGLAKLRNWSLDVEPNPFANGETTAEDKQLEKDGIESLEMSKDMTGVEEIPPATD